MSEEFKLYAFPQGGGDGAEEEPDNPERDGSTIAAIARGYRHFWRKRGIKPPPVSSHFIQMPEEWD